MEFEDKADTATSLSSEDVIEIESRRVRYFRPSSVLEFENMFLMEFTKEWPLD
jgi:hypothetical protein